MNAFAHIQQTIAFTLCAIAFTACTKDELVAPHAPGQHVQGPGQAETRMLNNERDQFGRTDTDMHAPQNFPGNTRMLNNRRGHIGRGDGPTPPDFQDRPQIDLDEEAAEAGSASQRMIRQNEEVRLVLKPTEIAPTQHRTSIGHEVDEQPAPQAAGDADGNMPIILQEEGPDQLTH